MSTQKLHILKDTIAYSGSTAITQGISFLLAIYIRSELGPEAMGIWALLQVYLIYVAYTNLGMFGAVYRKIPILRGAGDEEKIESIKNTAFSYVSLSSTTVSLLLALGAFFFKAKLSEAMYYGLLCLALLNILQRANNFQLQILYAEKKFTFASWFKIFSAVANALLTVAFVWKFHLYGMYLATLLSYLFNVLYLQCLSDLRFRFQWKRDEIKELIFFGVPLVGLNFTNKLFNTLDKIMIGKIFGLKALGIYSLAMMASNYIFMIPNMFQVVLFPRTLEKFGEENSAQGRKKYSTLPGQVVAIYFSLAIAACWILAPYLCTVWLPKYQGGIAALKILIFGGAFLALQQQMSHILLGYKRHLWMIPVLLGLSLVMWLGSLYEKSLGGTITTISLLATLSYFASYLFSTWFALRPLYVKWGVLKQLLVVITPLIGCLLVLILFDTMWPEERSLSLTLLKLGLYSALWISSLLILQDHSQAIRAIVDVFQEWRRSKRKKYEPVVIATD